MAVTQTLKASRCSASGALLPAGSVPPSRMTTMPAVRRRAFWRRLPLGSRAKRSRRRSSSRRPGRSRSRRGGRWCQRTRAVMVRRLQRRQLPRRPRVAASSLLGASARTLQVRAGLVQACIGCAVLRRAVLCCAPAQWLAQLICLSGVHGALGHLPGLPVSGCGCISLLPIHPDAHSILA